jgi:predicted RNA binding protein YcfA (HicA-like mRNA interferase family)
MPRKIRDLRADLRQAGFNVVRQKGSHERWRHPLLPDLPITVAGKDGADAKLYLEKLLESAMQALEEKMKDDESN